MRLSQQAASYMGFLDLNKCFSSGGILGGSIFSGVLIGTISFFVSAPFDVGVNVMPHTASRRCLLSAVRSSSSRRRLARSNTRRVL